MKIKIPYVIVTSVKGREVDDTVFIDTTSKKNAADVLKEQTGARVLETTAKKCDLEMSYDDVVPEVIFAEVCKASGANKAWDDLTGAIVDVKEGESNG